MNIFRKKQLNDTIINFEQNILIFVLYLSTLNNIFNVRFGLKKDK